MPYAVLPCIFFRIFLTTLPIEDKIYNAYMIFFFYSLPHFFKIYFTGTKAWDEVAEHSREFIQEYLEEFPNVSLGFCKELFARQFNFDNQYSFVLLYFYIIFLCFEGKENNN